MWASAARGKSGGKDLLTSEVLDLLPVLVKLQIWRCYRGLLLGCSARAEEVPESWDVLQLAGIPKVPPVEVPTWDQLRWISKVCVPANTGTDTSWQPRT